MHFKAIFDLVTHPGVASGPTYLGAIIGAIVGAIPYFHCIQLQQCAMVSGCQSNCSFPLHYVLYGIIAGFLFNAARQIFN